MPRDVIPLFDQEAGSKLIKRHCRAIRLPFADLKELVEQVVDKQAMARRAGLWQAFDEILGSSTDESKD